LEAKPATPVPATPRSTTTSTTGDDSTGDESTSTAGTVPSNPWSELIAPILNLIGSTSSRLHLPG
jgi:hypothetical protein